MEATKRRVSFADLQRMPDDGNRYELYDGELRVVPAPLPIHQRVAARLHLLLAEYVRSAVLVRNPQFTRQLRQQFEGLVQTRAVVELPGFRS